MSSIHTPQRLDGESFDAYKTRRLDSRAAMRKSIGHGLNGGTNARATYRNNLRSSGAMGLRTRAYKALMAAWAERRVTKTTLRDEHGAVTLIGKPYALEGVHPTSREVVLEGWVDGDEFGYAVRRKWLAGVSAQRGY